MSDPRQIDDLPPPPDAIMDLLAHAMADEPNVEELFDKVAELCTTAARVYAVTQTLAVFVTQMMLPEGQRIGDHEPTEGEFVGLECVDPDGNLVSVDALADADAEDGARTVLVMRIGAAFHSGHLDPEKATRECIALYDAHMAGLQGEAFTEEAMNVFMCALKLAAAAGRQLKEQRAQTFDTVVATYPGHTDRTIVAGLAFAGAQQDLTVTLRQIDQQVRDLAGREGITLAPGPLEYDLPKAWQLAPELRRAANAGYRQLRKQGRNVASVEAAVIVRGWRRRALEESDADA